MLVNLCHRNGECDSLWFQGFEAVHQFWKTGMLAVRNPINGKDPIRSRVKDSLILTSSDCPTRWSKFNNLVEQPLAEDLALSIGVTGELVEVDMTDWDYPQAARLLVCHEQTGLID